MNTYDKLKQELYDEGYCWPNSQVGGYHQNHSFNFDEIKDFDCNSQEINVYV